MGYQDFYEYFRHNFYDFVIENDLTDLDDADLEQWIELDAKLRHEEYLKEWELYEYNAKYDCDPCLLDDFSGSFDEDGAF